VLQLSFTFTQETTKVCSTCRESKSTSEFHKDRSAKDGFTHKCKSCMKNYQRSIKLINQSKDYSKDDFNLKCTVCSETKHCSEFSKKVYSTNGYRPYCKTCNNARCSSWRKTNPHKANRLKAERRARKLRQTPSWADKEAVEAVYLEAQLKSKETGIAHHVDHMVPLKGETVSGLHVQGNLQVLTYKENSSKGNRHWPDDWSDYLMEKENECTNLHT